MNADWLFQFSNITGPPLPLLSNVIHLWQPLEDRTANIHPLSLGQKTPQLDTYFGLQYLILWSYYQKVKQCFWHEPFPNIPARSTSWFPTGEIHSAFSDQIPICCHLLCLKLHPDSSILLLLFCHYYGNPWMDVICTIHYVIRNHFTCSQIQWSTFRLNILALGFSELSTDGDHLFRAMALLSDEWARIQQLP